MKITKTQNGSELIVALEGGLDSNSAPQLETELKSCIKSIDKLTLDFEKLNYISSAGLRVLLSAQKKLKKKGGVTVKNVSEGVREVFELTGFTRLMTVE